MGEARQRWGRRDTCRWRRASVGDRIAGDYYRHVLGLDAEALARAFVGLLYLDDRVREGYAPPPDRDTLATDRGLALFAGRGRARWH